MAKKGYSKIDASLEEEDDAFRAQAYESDSDEEGVGKSGKSASAPECKVPIFKRGNRDLTIETWFYQMRAYLYYQMATTVQYM